MTRARSEDDLKPCRHLIEHLFGKETLDGKKNGSSIDESNRIEMESTAAAKAQPYSFPNLCTRIELGENFASKGRC